MRSPARGGGRVGNCVHHRGWWARWVCSPTRDGGRAPVLTRSRWRAPVFIGSGWWAGRVRVLIRDAQARATVHPLGMVGASVYAPSGWLGASMCSPTRDGGREVACYHSRSRSRPRFHPFGKADASACAHPLGKAGAGQGSPPREGRRGPRFTHSGRPARACAHPTRHGPREHVFTHARRSACACVRPREAAGASVCWLTPPSQATRGARTVRHAIAGARTNRAERAAWGVGVAPAHPGPPTA